MRPFPPSKDFKKSRNIGRRTSCPYLATLRPSSLSDLPSLSFAESREQSTTRFTQELFNNRDPPVSINPTHAKSPASSDGSTDRRGCGLGENLIWTRFRGGRDRRRYHVSYLSPCVLDVSNNKHMEAAKPAAIITTAVMVSVTLCITSVPHGRF